MKEKVATLKKKEAQRKRKGRRKAQQLKAQVPSHQPAVDPAILVINSWCIPIRLPVQRSAQLTQISLHTLNTWQLGIGPLLSLPCYMINQSQ
uniref:Uncharacterized protein n=1 Tax=Cannabis sativa TaxID=3483 RepID=A0A803NPY2_CANSA